MTDPTGPSDADLTRLLDETRGDDAARDRSRRRWLQQQALSDARVDDVLAAAAEQHQNVTLRLQSGAASTGTVDRLGEDFCTLATATGHALVRLDAIAVVLPDPSLAAVPPSGGRVARAHLNFVEALGEHAEDRPTVALGVLGAAERVRGTLLAVGADVATLELGERASLAYVSLSAVTDASFLASG
jgi:hypothetical protein